MRTAKKWFIFCITALLVFSNFCYADENLSIVCTSFPCYDFARAVAGDRASVKMLIKPGSEVHSYEPTPADILSIADCDLFVYIGGESDAWVEDILSSFGDDAPRSLRLFDCADGLMHQEEDHAGHDHHDEHAEYDEHIWTSQTNARTMVDAISDVLCEISPENEDFYHQNALIYNEEISKINAEIIDIVENARRREMIFADRFPFIYFAEEYGLEYYAAFPSCAAESEPSAKTMMELIDKVISDQIPVVYTIELSSGKTAKTIAEETGVEVLTFHSIQNVTEEDFAAGETYITLMQRNVEALKKGLN